ncbi:MAG: hypothetical protein JWM69_382 [Candidatus Binatus sp.]|nr:hypothetical protein [Candidatus Binatus sp.]
MVPSVDCARRGMEKETPIREWDNVDQFASQQSCEDFKATVAAAEKGNQASIFSDRYSYATCVSDDDVRLKAGK